MLRWSTTVFLAKGIMLCLSYDPHPRDKRACLPKISSLHKINKNFYMKRPTKRPTHKIKTHHSVLKKTLDNTISCRGRGQTSTRWLAIAQSSVVDPGRSDITTQSALHYVYPIILTPETRGHVCQKFHHPTISNNLYTPTYLKNSELQYYMKTTISL